MTEPAGRRRRPASQRRRGAGDEAGMRGIVGAGPTRLPTGTAMRARDAARPTPADEAAAERDLRVVRRNYAPPASGSGGSTPERS